MLLDPAGARAKGAPSLIGRPLPPLTDVLDREANRDSETISRVKSAGRAKASDLGPLERAAESRSNDSARPVAAADTDWGLA